MGLPWHVCMLLLRASQMLGMRACQLLTGSKPSAMWWETPYFLGSGVKG